MERLKSYDTGKPTLYLVPTPIGNLEDMTYRAVRILQESDVIYAEDTRVTQKLLRHFQISKPLKVAHEHNQTIASQWILSDLQEGKNVALVSDAGMPLVSDPGAEVVSSIRRHGFPVVCLPGPSALLTGLVASGMKVHPFLFVGFLDAKKTKRIQSLEELQFRTETLVFYEAPHRIQELVDDLYQVFGSRSFAIARELTKTFEEIITGNLEEQPSLDGLKGEMVVIVSGYEQPQEEITNLSIVEQVDLFVKDGMSKTDAMKQVSLLTGIPKNTIYQEYLKQSK